MSWELLIIGLFFGFYWGDWFASLKKTKPQRDVGIELLTTMLVRIQKKQRWVPDDTKIIASNTLDVDGKPYKLSLESLHEWEGRD